jgi:hypothetical protein
MEAEIRTRIEHALGVLLGNREGDVRASLKELDGLATETTGHLRHYLAKRSYQKAWILLQGGDPEKGVCS